METWSGSMDQNCQGNIKGLIPGTGRLFRHGRGGKKATARTSCCNSLNATMPATEEPTTTETQARAWVPARAWVKKDKSIDANNRRNAYNSMDAGNNMKNGKSMDASKRRTYNRKLIYF
jgi:hypothetical protein